MAGVAEFVDVRAWSRVAACGVDRSSGWLWRFWPVASGALLTLGFMTDAAMPERIAARRAELDSLEEWLVKRLAEVRDERDELVVAERVVQRISEQGFGEYSSLAPTPEAQVGGRSVLLIPVRVGDGDPGVPRRTTSAS